MGSSAIGGNGSNWQNVEVTMKGQKTTVQVNGDEGLKQLESIIGKDHDISMSELAALNHNTAVSTDAQGMAHRIDVKVGGQAKFDVNALSVFVTPANNELASNKIQGTTFGPTIQNGSALMPRRDEFTSAFQARFDGDLAKLMDDPTISNDDKIRYMQFALQTHFTADASAGVAQSARTNGMDADSVKQNQSFLQHGREALQANITALGGDPNGSFKVLPQVANR